jgi:hypothetical protein
MDDSIERKEFDLPSQITNENKFNIDNGFWDEFDDGGRILFNFLYESCERNQDSVFGTDIFRMDDFTNEQVVKVQRMIHCAKHNLAILAAGFVSGTYDYEYLK